MSFSDKLGSLSNVREDQSSPKQKDSSTETPAGYIQRCVIIQRDEKGYGFTVRGDNPVYVELVKPDGAAAKAGVQQGDRIIKVNGTLVTNSNHLEVVKLIKSGSFVALTLLNKPSGAGQTAADRAQNRLSGLGPPSKDIVTAPQPVDAHKSLELKVSKVLEIQKYYEIAEEDCEKCKKAYQKSPSEKLYAQLQEKEKTVKTLKDQLDAVSSSLPPDYVSSDVDQVSSTPWTTSLPNTSVDVGSSLDSPHNSPSASPTPLHPGNSDDTDFIRQEPGLDDTVPLRSSEKQHQDVNIIAMEDDEFESDEEHGRTDDHGPFNDLRMLENKLAHTAIFLNFLLMENHDPSAFLFYLTSNVYSATTGSTKELKKWAYEIHSTFIVLGAPLRVNVEDNIVLEVDKVLKSDKEDALKAIFIPTRQLVQQEIQSQLQIFRQKKDMGMGNMFGAHDVREGMKKSEETEVIAKYLIKHLDKALQTDFEETVKSDRELAIYWALSTFLRYVGANKHNSNIEKIPSFVLKERKLNSLQKVSFRYSGKPKNKTYRGHQFLVHSYNKVELCLYCGLVIWGIGHQGYQCQACELNVHRQCMDMLEECHACNKKKRQSRPGIMSALRKSQPAPLKESERDMGSPGPQANTVFNIQSAKDEDDSDLAAMKNDPHSVSKLVSRFDQIQGTDKKRSQSQLSEPESNQSDVDMDETQNALRALNSSGSSSTSSLTNRSVGDSPSNSLDAVNNIPQVVQEDSDFEVEQELPPLKSVLPDEVYKKLKPKERKRQDVINELFYTERSHVRNLKIMDFLFYKQMSNDNNISEEFTKLLFPNLEDMIQLHCSMNNEMKSRRKENKLVDEVGDILLRRFDNEEGEAFRNGCAIFCRNQSLALDTLRSRQKKDVRLAQLINDNESSAFMRRLQLKDLIPTQMMRLTKYPLLIENLLKYTRDQSEEHSRLQRALQCCKHILEYVNQAVKEYENIYRLEQLQRKIEKKVNSNSDKEEDLKNLDLRQHTLVYDGLLTWNMNQRKTVDVHVVLLDDLLVLLQKQDDKLVLKCQSTQLVAGKDDSKYLFSPLLKLNNVLHTNSKATDKKAFFVVSKSQIYELSAHTADEQRKWCKYIKEAADTYKDKDIKARKLDETPISADVPQNQTEQNRTSANTGSGDFLEQVESSEEPNLIQPEDLVIKDPVSAKALPFLTPIEKLRRLDADINFKMKERNIVLAQILGVPVKNIPDRVEAALSGGKSLSDLLLAMAQESEECINLANSAQESGLAKEDLTMPIPMDKLRDIANRMNQILTNLLAVVNSRDEERERLRQELKAAQDELNMLREIQRRVSSSSPTEIPLGRPASMISEASTMSDVGEEGTITQIENLDTELEVVKVTESDEMDTVSDDTDRQENMDLDVSMPTEIPQEIEDILPNELSVAEPPEQDSMEDKDPPGISEEELTNPANNYVEENVLIAGIVHVEETEVLSETVELLPETNGGVAVDSMDRRDSEDNFQDASEQVVSEDGNNVVQNGEQEVEHLQESADKGGNPEDIDMKDTEVDGLEKSDTEKIQDSSTNQGANDSDLTTDLDNEKLRTGSLCEQEIIKPSETGDTSDSLLIDNKNIENNVEQTEPGDDLSSPVDI